jgi:hypothetical protein
MSQKKAKLARRLQRESGVGAYPVKTRAAVKSEIPGMTAFQAKVFDLLHTARTQEEIDYRKVLAALEWDALNEEHSQQLTEVGITERSVYVELRSFYPAEQQSQFLDDFLTFGLGFASNDEEQNALISAICRQTYLERLIGQNDRTTDLRTKTSTLAIKPHLNRILLDMGGRYFFSAYPKDTPEFRLWIDAMVETFGPPLSVVHFR